MIGYYVHHHGSGHITRATAIAASCQVPVTGLSSRPRPEGWTGEWVDLPRDDSSGIDSRADADITAGGTLHWAPVGHDGYGERMTAVAAWIARARPSLFVSDVSVEMTMLARLLGVQVAVLAMRGDRSDRPHRAAYDAATLLLAPWPGALPEPLRPDLRAKTLHTGAFSRFDGASVPSATKGARHRVSVLWGRGGGEWTDDHRHAAGAATPGYLWETAGRDRPVWESLTAADVVVTHAGQNAVAEVAAARRPAVVVALPRPHGEQEATVAALESGRIAATSVGVPTAAEWPALLYLARRRNPDGQRWRLWSDGHGARRAAAALEAVASGRRIAGGTAVITLVHGRHDHLRALIAGLAAGTALPERFVVVSLGDEKVAEVARAACAGTPLVPEVVALPDLTGAEGLALAAARNLGAATAAEQGCVRAIFLDVDCIPGAGLVARYHDALRLRRDEGAPEEPPTVYAGPVTYLPPTDGEGYDLARLPELRSPHPARPAPADGEQMEGDDLRLFWSLSFAVTLADYDRIGGFCEQYTGYGGEDTDFAMALGAADGRLVWLGGADAYHQYHPTSSPPTQHLHDIVRNANLFTSRWGRPAMEGWLAAFAERGLAHHDEQSGRWVVTSEPHGQPRRHEQEQR